MSGKIALCDEHTSDIYPLALAIYTTRLGRISKRCCLGEDSLFKLREKRELQSAMKYIHCSKNKNKKYDAREYSSNVVFRKSSCLERGYFYLSETERSLNVGACSTWLT